MSGNAVLFVDLIIETIINGWYFVIMGFVTIIFLLVFIWNRNGSKKQQTSSVVLIEDLDRTLPPSSNETIPQTDETNLPFAETIPQSAKRLSPLEGEIPGIFKPWLGWIFKLPWKMIGQIAGWTVLGIIFVYGAFYLESIWPHSRYAPEVDAAIITSIITSVSSSLTIFITVGYTVKSNREMQEAMKEQSRSSLRDKLWENRQQIYPQLRILNKDIRNKLEQEPNKHARMKKALESLEEYQLNNEHHLSEDLLILLKQMMSLCQLKEKDPISDQLHKNFLEVNWKVDAQILLELRLNLPDRDLKAMMKSDSI